MKVTKPVKLRSVLTALTLVGNCSNRNNPPARPSSSSTWPPPKEPKASRAPAAAP
jgi:hypothetical protein